jgi:hypothetical protein
MKPKMRLSDAILRGSRLGEQMFGEVSDDEWNSCALGAAGLALTELLTGVPTLYNPAYRIFMTWPWLKSDGYECPAGCGQKNIPAAIISHLNDDHRWPRQRIAEWVATIEPKEPTESQKEPALASEEKDSLTTSSRAPGALD